MHFSNFDLEAFNYTNDENGECFRVRVANSPAGEQKISESEAILVPKDFREQLQVLDHSVIEVGLIIEIGKILAGLLFPTDIRSLYQRSLEKLGEEEGLRIRLKFDTYALADLPWEFLYLSSAETPPDQKSAEGFLSLNRKISLVRYEVMSQSHAPLAAIPGGKLRMVALLANSTASDLPPLDLKVEKKRIKAALNKVPNIKVEFFEPASVESLEQALVREAHIFHFSGHGQFEDELDDSSGLMEGTGYIYLAGENGQDEKFSAEQLSQNLRGRGVRLVVLGACEGGRRDQFNAWTGVAAALVRAGIPAVVAMQYSILDVNAITFSQSFYRALAAGQPVDSAVNDGRLAIYNRMGPSDRDWGVPVLYMRDEEGVLFPKAANLTSGTQLSTMEQLKPGQPGWIVLLATAAALFISLLSGINQIAGFFGKINIASALFSVVLAGVVAFAFPVLLRKQFPTGEKILKLSYQKFSLLFALLVMLLGLVPFFGKLGLAMEARAEGNQYLDASQYARAKVDLDRAARYYTDLGFTLQATDTKLTWIQTIANIGNPEQAEQMLKDLNLSGQLNQSLQGKLNVIQGNIAYLQGDFENTERFYQLAHQNIEPASLDEAILLQNEAVVWILKGGVYRERAKANLDQALTIYRTEGDLTGEAFIMLNQSTLVMNEPVKARQILEDALALVRSFEIANPSLEATILLNIGFINKKMGMLDQAEQNYQEALQKFEQAADFLSISEVLVNQAQLDWDRGKNELARQKLQSAEAYLNKLDLEGELTNPRKVASIRTFQGDIYDSLGESAASESYYQAALTIYQEHPAPLQEAQAQANYGSLLIRLGRDVDAESLLRRAMEILTNYSTLDTQEQQGNLFMNLGELQKRAGNISQAMDYYRKAEAIYEEIQNPLRQAEVFENEGVILEFQGAYGEALSLFQQAEEVYRLYENMDHLVKNLYNQFTIYVTTHDDSKMEMVLDEIFSILQSENIDQTTKSPILLGFYPEDFSTRGDLIIYREQVLNLRDFYQERQETGIMAQCLIKLGLIELKLGHQDEMVVYAKEAEPYLEQIPEIQQKMVAHQDIGLLLLIDNPETGIDHYFAAFDLAESVNPDHQLFLAQQIQTYLTLGLNFIDRQKYIDRSQAVLENSPDPAIRAIFEQIMETLK